MKYLQETLIKYLIINLLYPSPLQLTPNNLPIRLFLFVSSKLWQVNCPQNSLIDPTQYQLTMHAIMEYVTKNYKINYDETRSF